MKIPLFKIYSDKKDIEAVAKVIRAGGYWATGPQVEEFEQKVAKYLKAKYCLTFNSGGSALFALMKAYGLKKGDEVIVPSFTFIATAFAPMYVGAKPVFADIETKTFGLDPEDVERKITKKTRAIMPIHYGGMACRIEELKKIAKKHKLILIEDAAQSFGAKFGNKNVGTFGDAAIFSFCHNKVFTTGEGGCAITDSKDIYEKIKLVRSYGRKVKGDYFTNPENLDYIEAGYNLRMPTMSAALGISQLSKVNKTIKLRRKKADYLNKKLKDVKQIVLPEKPSKKHFCVYQMYTIRTDKKVRDELMVFLKEKGISVRIYFDPIHKYSVFKKEKNISLPITEKLSKEVITLPLYPDITRKQLDFIVSSIKEFFKK
jgi:perosamine synthetase